ncbi:MAG: ABC transporter permease subunit [Bdellovibrionales bacterium]|nr:ABC transporter permease subunit [Bdellovibrionales bacterium]MBT3526884.1 ABC transporter permease subunit [Bdellovibrionales bacterium]MBT7668707.1 ABC transporter permease subunit [Bdellovibrionales bacterium]MBT7765745.1 ABC transporter permease subunit [Bdellovibrionales bacterium]
MYQYIIRRLLIIIPTLFGVTVIVFGIINLAPGSPVEQRIQQLRFGGMGSNAETSTDAKDSAISEEVIEALRKQYGFDKPVHIRYWIWLKNLSRLDFGESFTYEEPVLDVIVSKFPVSLQFGVVSLLLSYLICVPLGVFKAIKHGTKFDLASSFMLFAMYSVPPFMLGILLIVFFAGGSFLDIFPIGELYSDMYEELGFFDKILDRLHHFILPLSCYLIGQFTVLTMLMKNSLLEEIKKDYVRTARAKGVSERKIYLKHALRNALIPIVTGIGGFLMIFFAGSLLLETIFQLDGIGLLGYQSVLSRDYNVIMGLVFIQSLLMLIGNLISDMAYVLVDPRIDFK